MSSFPLPILISVGDPWEFGEAIKWKLIAGYIMSVGIDDKSGEEKALIKLNKSIDYNDGFYDYIVASTRYERDKISEINDKTEIIGNFIGISDKQALSNKPLDVSWWRGGGLVFNGGIKLKNLIIV